MTARAQRGLPITSRVPMSHVVVRDQTTGKALCLEVNEDKRRLWTGLAELILEGVSSYGIEEQLNERYRRVYDENEPIPEGATIFHNTHEAVWPGEIADRVKTEIRRRSESVRGSSTPHSTHRFA